MFLDFYKKKISFYNIPMIYNIDILIYIYYKLILNYIKL